MLRKHGIRHATLTDGEPLLTEQSREKCKVATEIFDQIWIVTNGTISFPGFRNTLYIVSLDGDEETHDLIRGKGVFAKIKENISSCQVDCCCNATLTRLNHGKIQGIIDAAKQLERLDTIRVFGLSVKRQSPSPARFCAAFLAFTEGAVRVT